MKTDNFERNSRPSKPLFEQKVDLEATPFQRALTFFLAAILPAIVIIVGVSAWWWATPPLPLVEKALSLAMPGLIFYSYSLVVTRLMIFPGGRFECSSLLRQTTFQVTDIRKIDMRLWNRGFIHVTTLHAKIYFYRDMPGALNTMRRIASEHPQIRVKQ